MNDPISILFAIGIVAYFVVKFGGGRSRRRNFYRDRSPWRDQPRVVVPLPQKPVVAPLPDKTDMANPHNQLEAVAAVEFETVPMLNHSEARLLPILEKAVRDYGDRHRLMAQISLGELIRPKVDSAPAYRRDAAYASVNSKRLDFGIIDRKGHLKAAIEYQGHGHHGHNKTFLRDAVKREALRKAGVEYVEIPAEYDPELVRQTVQRLLRPTQ